MNPDENPEVQNEEEEAYHRAIVSLDLDEIEYYVQRGANVDEKVNGMTALDIAIEREDEDAIVRLLELGADNG